LGHADLHLGNVLLKEDSLYLLDGYAVRPGGLRMRDLLLLAHSVSRFAGVSEILRGWEVLGEGRDIPRNNPVRRRLWRKAVGLCPSENRYYGRLRMGAWRGVFARHCKFPRRWAPVSRLDVSNPDWEREWPNLLARIDADQLDILKRTASGDVLA